jgi:DNA-binding PucR family transcriptional regulator
VSEIRDATALVFALTSQIVAAVYGADVPRRPEAVAPLDRGLVGRLLTGTVPATRAAESGDTFFVRAPAHAVVVVGTIAAGPTALTIDLSRALSCLSQGSYRSVVAEHEGNVVAIAPIVSRTLNDLTAALSVAFDERTRGGSGRLIAGVGNATTELPGLPRAYEQARRAFELVRDVSVLGDIMTYVDSLPYQLLHADLERAADLAAILAPLAVQDRQGQTRLMDTLLAVVTASGNLSQAAKDLNVHRQTLYARVARISDLTGKRVDDPDEFLLLHLAVHARRMLSGMDSARQ